MAKKEYPPWHYFAAAALAYLVGATYTFSMFHLVLGPGMLVVGTAFLLVGLRKRRRKAEASAAPAPVPRGP